MSETRDPIILIVEDEPKMAYVLRQALQEHGYRPHTALNGFEALSSLQATPPAAVILDLNLPGLSGLELLQRLRQQFPQTKVIILSGHIQEYSQLAGEMGVEEILQKPVRLETLISSVTRLVPLDSSAPSP